jgi:hypothetical protein
MPDNVQSALAFRAFHEVQIEMGIAPAAGRTLFPVLPENLPGGLVSLPEDALLFGISADGLPLLLHLRDPRPGPVLVIGERGSGKTDFLKLLLLAEQRLAAPSAIRFVILTDHPADFDEIHAPERLLGVYPAYEAGSAEMLSQLAWRVQSPQVDQPILLLMDGLESILQMEAEAQENLAYILVNGPQALVWPVVTINSEMGLRLPEWLAYFRTRIYGRIANPSTAEALTPIPGAPLNSLFPGAQFCLRQNSNWLRFWLPSLPA